MSTLRILNSAALICLATAGSWCVAPRPVAAQDRSADVDLEMDVERALDALNAPIVQRQPRVALEKVQHVLAFEHPLADDGLRARLADARTPAVIVEQLVVALLIERRHRRLLPEVIERLVQERESELDQRIAATIMSYADADLVGRLGRLARDPSRSVTFRVEALRNLARTGIEQALDPIVIAWGSPDEEVREAAAAAWFQVLPRQFDSAAEAREFLERKRQEGLPFSEWLREIIRAAPEPVEERGHTSADPSDDPVVRYLDLARAAIGHVPLDVVRTSYLSSPLAEVRRLGADRIAGFDFQSLKPAEVREEEARATLGACLDRLVAEQVPEVQQSLVAAVSTHRMLVGGAPDERVIHAVLAIAASGDPEFRKLRMSAVKLLGDLRDGRAVRPLQEMFESLGDADHEFRNQILESICSSTPERVIPWLVARAGDEKDDRVLGTMVYYLGSSRDAQAIQPLRRLLQGHANPDIRFKSALHLGTLFQQLEVDLARNALLEGLADAESRVRKQCVVGLRHGALEPVTNRETISRLRGLVVQDTEADVRVQAARTILDLDEEGALDHLVDAFGQPPIWELYRNRVTDFCRETDSPARALADARELDGSKDPERRTKAVELLSWVADARQDGSLWQQVAQPPETAPVRGVVREELARMLLESGDADGALRRIGELLAVAPRPNDPRGRWTVLHARALRIRGSADDLASARTKLQELRRTPAAGTPAAAPGPLRLAVLLELSEVLLAQNDPWYARAVLDETAGEAMARAVQAATPRIADLRERLQAAREAERARAVALARDAAPGFDAAAARETLKKDRVRVAPALASAIDQAVEAADRDREFQLLWAVVHSLGRTLTGLPRELTPQINLSAAREEARGLLAQIVETERQR